MTKNGKIDSEGFWERIDSRRDAKGISLIDLQTAIGKSGTYMYVARCHQSIPSVDLLMKMADVLDCSVDYLLGRPEHSYGNDELDQLISMFRNHEAFRTCVRPLMASFKD